MADWDETSPEDNDLVSQYPANERAARAAVKTNFGVDHHEDVGDDIGKHTVIHVLNAEEDPTFSAGEVGVWNNGGSLKFREGAETVKEVASQADVDAAMEMIPSGTKMVFFQSSPPTGWTQDTDVNNRLLRVVSGTGGGTGGTWTISGLTVAGHSLTVAQMPSHSHGGSTGNRSPGTNTAGAHRHSINGSNTNSPGTIVGSRHTSARTFVAGDTAATASLINHATFSSSGNFVMSSEGGHSHTVSSHDHSISSQGGGSSHTHGISHDGTWSPSHIDVIVAARD
jgi:hypothetical protein